MTKKLTKKRKVYLSLMIGILSFQPIGADSFNEGKDISLSPNSAQMDAMSETGIPVDENPKEASYMGCGDLKNHVDAEKHAHEGYATFQDSNQKRELIDIESEIETLDQLHAEEGNEIGDEAYHESSGSEEFTQKCYRSGDAISVTCKRHRVIELRVTPEVISHKERFCLGHWKGKFRRGKNYCNPGCRGGEAYVSQEKKVEITKDEWIGCEELDALHDEGKAEVISEELGPFNETRTISGEPVQRDYWETTRTYSVKALPENTCQPLLDMGCHMTGESRCIAESTEFGSRRCTRFETTVTCRTRSSSIHRRKDPLQLQLPEKQTYSANQNMFQALSQLEAMRQIAKNQSIEGGNVTIFKGDANRCTTNFGGSFKDCCRSSGGFGTDIGLATGCTVEEKNLQKARRENRCIFIGSKKKSSVLGMNLSKEYVFCCFPSKIGLAIQKGARAQLGKSFGSVDAPLCEGLTPDELTRVDFARIDLSDSYKDIAAFAQKLSASIQTDLKQTQNALHSQQKFEEVKQQNKHHLSAYKGNAHEQVF